MFTSLDQTFYTFTCKIIDGVFPNDIKQTYTQSMKNIITERNYSTVYQYNNFKISPIK